MFSIEEPHDQKCFHFNNFMELSQLSLLSDFLWQFKKSSSTIFEGHERGQSLIAFDLINVFSII